MGRIPQICGQSTTTTTTNFDKAEKLAFDHVGQALRLMPYCSLEDLEQAAFSYLVQSFASSGVSVREEWARGKAEKWAAWWARKHRDQRRPRPHTRYSRDQAARGRVVSQIRRGTRADVDGLLVQLQAQQGAKLSEIADGIGRTVQHTRRLLGRRFSKLLVWIIIGTFGNGSAGFPPNFDTGRDQKETLPNVRLADVSPASSVSLGKMAEINAMGAAIPDLLRSHWAAQGL